MQDRQSEEDDETSGCGVCRKPEDEDEDGKTEPSWIECDNCFIWYHMLCIQTGMTFVMRMMCLYTGSAMFAHDKMCIILLKCLVRVML